MFQLRLFLVFCLIPSLLWSAPYDTPSLQLGWKKVQQDFHSAFGGSVNPSDISILQAMNFFTLRPWLHHRKDESLGEFRYNPDALTRLMGRARNQNKCVFRTAAGARSILWDSVRRTIQYRHQLSGQLRERKPLEWSPNYLSQPHVKAFFQSPLAREWYVREGGDPHQVEKAKAYYGGGVLPASSEFDHDILFSVHAVALDGAYLGTEESCGGPGEFEACSSSNRARVLALARRPIQVVKNIARYFKDQNADDIVSIASRAQKDINSIHPFRDGNGRTARAVGALLLETAELPPPILLNGYLEESLDYQKFEFVTRRGIDLVTRIVSGCTAFLECLKESSLFHDGAWKDMCVQESACNQLLPEVASDMGKIVRLDGCDCSPYWREQVIELAQCTE